MTSPGPQDPAARLDMWRARLPHDERAVKREMQIALATLGAEQKAALRHQIELELETTQVTPEIAELRRTRDALRAASDAGSLADQVDDLELRVEEARSALQDLQNRVHRFKEGAP